MASTKLGGSRIQDSGTRGQWKAELKLCFQLQPMTSWWTTWPGIGSLHYLDLGSVPAAKRSDNTLGASQTPGASLALKKIVLCAVMHA